MNTEGKLWDWLRPVLPAGQYTRIESECSPGFPDVHFQLKGRRGTPHCGTLELKVPRRVPRFPESIVFDGKKHGMRPSQIRWITDNVEQGGLVWIVTIVDRMLLFIPGSNVKLVNQTPLKVIERITEHRVSTTMAEKQITAALFEILGGQR